jgi:hypothetical protein
MELTTTKINQILSGNTQQVSKPQTVTETGLQALGNKLATLKKDIYLSELLVKYSDMRPDAFLDFACFKGSQSQRNAVARSFGIDDGLCLKDLMQQIQSAESPTSLLEGYSDFMIEQINLVCKSFGASFNGVIKDVIDVMINRFGGFNLLDWTLFFYRLKEGKYRTEFQSVNTRGVNLEFLIDWCEKYANEKEIAVQEANKKTKQETVINVTLPQEMTQQIREREAKAQALKDMRHNWETSDFTEFESIDTEGKPIILEYRHPNIKEVAKVVCSFMWITAEYETTKKDFEFWDFYKSKVTSLWYQIKNAKTNIFYQLYAVKIDPEKNFTFELEKHFETFVDSEYVGYGSAMIEKQAATEQKLFVMNRKEFALWCVLELYRKRGFDNPLN